MMVFPPMCPESVLYLMHSWMDNHLPSHKFWTVCDSLSVLFFDSLWNDGKPFYFLLGSSFTCEAPMGIICIAEWVTTCPATSFELLVILYLSCFSDSSVACEMMASKPSYFLLSSSFTCVFITDSSQTWDPWFGTWWFEPLDVANGNCCHLFACIEKAFQVAFTRNSNPEPKHPHTLQCVPVLLLQENWTHLSSSSWNHLSSSFFLSLQET